MAAMTRGNGGICETCAPWSHPGKKDAETGRETGTGTGTGVVRGIESGEGQMMAAITTMSENIMTGGDPAALQSLYNTPHMLQRPAMPAFSGVYQHMLEGERAYRMLFRF